MGLGVEKKGRGSETKREREGMKEVEMRTGIRDGKQEGREERGEEDTVQ